MMRECVFRRPGGAALKLDGEALPRMLGFQQVDARHDEAGGVLLGRHILGSQDIVVDEVTVPMPGDRRMRLAFHRHHLGHQQVIDARWSASRGTCQYLGEWHTHPESHPVPSQVDLRDWRRRLREDVFDGESLFFLIVGTEEVGAWEGFRHSLELVQLSLDPGTRRRP